MACVVGGDRPEAWGKADKLELFCLACFRLEWYNHSGRHRSQWGRWRQPMRLGVEFLGPSRRLARTEGSLVEVGDGATLRSVIRHLAGQYPALVGPVIVPETFDLVPSYMINIDGRRAATDLDQRPQDGQRLILMFVEAGG